MIVSWNWLQDYIDLDVEPAEVERRLMMAGLNHESTEVVGEDLAIDLEVTSNRPDCLGHLGVAREIAVLFDRPLKLPAAAPGEQSTPVDELAQVRIDCPQLCYRYTARVIRGVTIGPSPAWLADRLATAGIAAINNVVDITNYVLLEAGQPLHAFDMAMLRGREIIVREAVEGEPFQAIDHKTYKLERGMCVIADAQRAVALGGVMGGVDSEVSPTTSELLIESAEFAPLSIRNTARRLNLHSPSSYRFERRVDPCGVEWASRRCCELILELAGGELAAGVIDVGPPIGPRQPVLLRLPQITRILGIEVTADEVRRILAALGNEELRADGEVVEVRPPSWRRDLTREVDLIEEVARIHGYEQIPEDVAVPMWPSHRSDAERVLDKLRRALTAAGFDEAMTASVVPGEWSAAFSPWTADKPITAAPPMKGILADAPQDLGQADTIRRSLIPSLLEARRFNESVGNPVIELFETARIYLPRPGQLPDERTMLAVTSGQDYYHVKGVIECLLGTLNGRAELEVLPAQLGLLEASRAAELRLNGQRLGYLGELTAAGIKQFSLRGPTTVAELVLENLQAAAELVPQYTPQIPFPSISRDLNLIVDERVRWADLAATVRQAAGPVLEQIRYRETYRDARKDGAGKKRLLLSIVLRAADKTLTNEQADQTRDTIVAACQKAHGAELLG